VNKSAKRLLRDIAALFERYPAHTWAELVSLLDPKKTRTESPQALGSVEKNEKLQGANQQKQGSRQVTSQKAKRAALEPEGKRDEWLELELSRLPIADLRTLLRNSGVPFSHKDSKDRLIRKILRTAPEQVGRSVARSIGRRNPGDYAQWAEIIMGGDKRKPTR